MRQKERNRKKSLGHVNSTLLSWPPKLYCALDCLQLLVDFYECCLVVVDSATGRARGTGNRCCSSHGVPYLLSGVVLVFANVTSLQTCGQYSSRYTLSLEKLLDDAIVTSHSASKKKSIQILRRSSVFVA
jgi:hypothetical protein